MSSAPSPAAKGRLGLWSLYFAGKLYFFFLDHIGFDLFWNGAFFLALLATARGFSEASRAARWTRAAAAGLAAAALLWHDSWLPPLGEELALLRQGAPSAAFTAVFLARTVLTLKAASLLALLAAVFWAGRRVHLTWVVLAAMALAGVRQTADANLTGLDGRLAAFYRGETGRRVDFAPVPAGAAPFDIVILHICSLAGDDLAASGLSEDPLWGEFDVLLTGFNTVSAHSGPAALRLLRAPCGQVRHSELYAPAPDECSLLGRLRALGYATYAANDHDGSFQGFTASLRRWGDLDLPEAPGTLPQALVNFDGAPIFDDSELLRRWWTERLASKAPRAALYANLISLHGGAHPPGERDWWKRSREESYRLRFARLAAAIRGFEDAAARSGRRVVLLVVPEHGAALRGSAMQPPDLRELPLPRITLAPVGIKLLGWKRSGGGQILVRKPTSYLALGDVLASLLREPEAGSESAALARIAARAPETAFVSENEAAVVLDEGSGYYLRTDASGWRRVSDDAPDQDGRRP